MLQFGTLPAELTRRMERFAREVMPQLKRVE